MKKMAGDITQIVPLYNLSIEVVFQYHVILRHDNIDFDKLPDRIMHDLIRRGLSYETKPNHSNSKNSAYRKDSDKKLRRWFDKISLNIWFRLLKYEAYKKTLLQFYQRLYDYDCKDNIWLTDRVDHAIVEAFQKLAFKGADGVFERNISKHIDYGLVLGSFFSEASWYKVSENILQFTKKLCDTLPENDVSTHLLRLECCHRLFHTWTMFFDFDNTAKIIDEIHALLAKLEKCGQHVNYALLFTEFSRYNFSKNNYEESYKWMRKAMNHLNDKLPISIIIQVLRQASKVCVVKRDFVKAKYLIYQALGRAHRYYGSKNYKMAGLLLDFGFYLLNSDQIEQSVSIYREVYSLRIDTIDSHLNNLHVAIAEEDLAYALYVHEYSSGYFESAMKHAKQAIDTMKKLLPTGNLMLSSANRVKALILEEMALENYTDHEELVPLNMDMFEEAEELHQGALLLTKFTFGEENILTAKHYGNLGRLYQSMRKYEEAEKMHLKAIKIKEKILGMYDYEVGLSVGHLASLYNYHMRKYEKAEELYHRSINIHSKLFSESYSGLEYDYRGLIHVYEHLGDDEQYLKFSNKFHKWNALRNKYTSENIGSDFYENIVIDPLDVVLQTYQPHGTPLRRNGESSQS